VRRVISTALVFAAGWCAVFAAPGKTESDILRIHREALGGSAAIASLRAMRVEGVTKLEAGEVEFTLWAARPAKLRLESRVGGQTMVQSYDGVTAAWGMPKGGAPALLSPGEAREFIAGADFDGPLVDPAAKGFAVTYAGEEEVEGRQCLHLMLAARDLELIELYVDAETYMVLKRIAARPEVPDAAKLETFFSDYRPVAGVMMPFRVTMFEGDRMVTDTRIERITPLAALPGSLFEMPTGG
jgi:outer membrane lipoprotein-sorting protein